MRIRQIAVEDLRPITVAITFLLAASPFATALQNSDQASLVLGTVAGEPGTNVTIPVYYKGGSPRSLHVEVMFVSQNVRFVKAEKGTAAETQDFDLEVRPVELPPDDKNIRRTRLNIDIAIADADASKVLPEGLWAFLEFNIPPEAKPFSISLEPTSLSAQNASKKPVRVAAEAGKIIVSVPDEPLVGCFFFTH